MKAIVCRNDGSSNVLHYEDVDIPTPADNQVLIKVRAASVNPVDGFPTLLARISRLTAGLYKPKVARLGTDVAGIVEAVGRTVTRFRPGDEVFGACQGAFAEYACANEKNLVLKPANVSFEQAAAVPVAAITALQGLRDKGGLQRGHKVLVEGAGGGVGTFTVQIAKALGAEVTAVCSTQNVETTRALGADEVLDYTREDFTKNGQRYNLIAAANAHRSLFDYWRALTPDGIFVMIGGGYAQILQVLLLGQLLSRMGKKQARFFIAEIRQDDLALLSELLEAGKIVPVIDRRYPLSGVADALRYREAGHARGKIIITHEENSGGG